MCTEIIKMMKMKRGYSDVVLMLRSSGVDFKSQGEQLLELAIMKSLEMPELEIEDLFKFAMQYSSFVLKRSVDELMKEALQTVYTKHSEKLQEEDVLEKFISNIADEIRMRKLIRLREVSEDLEIDNMTEDIVISIAMRRLNKPKISFQNILTWVAGKLDYDSEEALVKKAYEIVDKDFSETEPTVLRKNLEDCINNLLLERENIIF